MNLKLDILNELTEGELRPSEIRERLHTKWKKKYDSERSFDVIILRMLSGELSEFVDRDDRGHQRVYYSLNERGVKELEGMKIKGPLNKWIDEMTLAEIRDWYSYLTEQGLRVQAVKKAPVVRLKDGKIVEEIGEFTGTVLWKKKEKE